MAIKIQWVSKIKQFVSIRNLAFANGLTESIWDANIDNNDVNMNPRLTNNIFWNDVLLCWSKYHYVDASCKISKDRLLKMPVAHNSSLRVGRAVVSNGLASSLGLITIQDLTKEQNTQICQFQDWQDKFGVTQGNKIFQAQAIAAALPTQWRKILDGSLKFSPEEVVFCYEYCNITHKLTKMVYQQFSHRKLVQAKLASKWQNKIGLNVEVEDMDLAFLQIRELALSTKLRDFQFRFLHRKIFTNKILYQWKISDTDRCSFCQDHYETIEHLFYECQIVKRFWELFSNWYEAMTDTILNLSLDQIVFCCDRNESSRKVKLLDTLILMAKQFIFRNRCIDNIPGFGKFKDEMFYVCKIERSLAVRENRQKSFQKKWGLFLK